MRLIPLPCLILLLATAVPPQSAVAQQIGRLFMTPEARINLERIRQGGAPAQSKKEKIQQEVAVPEYVPIEGDDIIVLDGFVRRSGAANGTTWINSVPQYGGERPQGIAVMRARQGTDAVALKLASGKQVHLKAGQNVDAVSGRVLEGFQSENINIDAGEPFVRSVVR